MRRQNHQHAYILLMTLVLLAIIALATVGASSLALRQMETADEAEQELQRHWGQLSIERCVLPSAETILSSDEKIMQQPMVSCHHSLQLGNLNFELILSDEQAKPNVNAFLKNREKADAEIQLRQALSGIVPASLILLKPLSVGTGLHDPIMSYSQVLNAIDPQQLLASRLGLVCPAEALTCWGNGQVNVRRASLNTLREVVGNVFGNGGAEKLIAFRDMSPPISFDNMLKQMDLKSDQRQKLSAILMDHSACHSIWIIDKNPLGAAHYRFSVSTEGNSHGVVPMTFDW